MKKLFWLGALALVSVSGLAQSKKKDAKEVNTLLWRISGKGIAKPSYLFGTMHILCADDIQLSDSLNAAIERADDVYLELDMDNTLEMMGAITKMKMRNDTTLSDLLTKDEYEKVKAYFQKKSTVLPFAMVGKYKPFIASSLLMEQQTKCANAISMEKLIMEKAKQSSVAIRGMETVAYQLGIFDSIPYGYQAKQLVKMIELDKGGKDEGNEVQKLTEAYRNQQLGKLEEMTREGDSGIGSYADLLLYNRNRNWVAKLEDMLGSQSLVIAVGAGHLPGTKGVINLLRKAGYTVEPVKNEMVRSKAKQI